MQSLLFLSFLSFLFFIGLALPATCQHLLPGDEWIYRAIQARRSPFLDSFFHTVTRAGSYKVLIPVGMGILLWHHKHWQLLCFFVLYALGVLLLETGAKLAVARPRPHHHLTVGPLLQSSQGFPSGHALAAAAFYGMLLVLLHKRVRRRRWQWGITAGILLLILLIGFSRIYLGVHWPSDVLGGYALGGAYYSLAAAVYRWIERSSKAHKEGPYSRNCQEVYDR